MKKPIPNGYESHRELFNKSDGNKKVMGISNALWLNGWSLHENCRNDKDPSQFSYYIVYIRKLKPEVFTD